MSERRRLITVIAVSAAAVVVAATGAAGIGFLAENDGDTIVTHEPEHGSEGTADESTDATGEPEEPDGGPADEQADDESATGEEDMDSDLFQAGRKVLPRPMGGQQAIDTLGDELERVAEKNNRTVEELRDLLLRDTTVKITPSGFLVYGDTATPNPAAPSDSDE